MNKTFNTILLATALIPAAAFAQSEAPPAPANPPIVETVPAAPAPGDMATEPLPASPQVATAAGETFVTVPPSGAWLVADLEGKDVYGIDGEDIGEIKNVIVGEDGRVLAVIVGVGGFLGIGEKDVAVAMTALKFRPGMSESDVSAAGGKITPDPDQTGAIVDQNGDGSPDTAVVQTNPATDVAIGDDALPTHIVLNVTREELENAPAFPGIGGTATMETVVPQTTAPAQ